LEFQAIMCAFLSHGASMRNFPEVDPGRGFAPGQVLVLLTDHRGAFGVAAHVMDRNGTPLTFLWEQAIEGAGGVYWTTATEVRRP